MFYLVHFESFKNVNDSPITFYDSIRIRNYIRSYRFYLLLSSYFVDFLHFTKKSKWDFQVEVFKKMIYFGGIVLLNPLNKKSFNASMAKLADAPDLEPDELRLVRVQIPLEVTNL